MTTESVEIHSDTSPHEEFGKFIESLRDSEKATLSPGVIQMAAEVFNSERADKPDEQIAVLYHFTDKEGADSLKQSEFINTGKTSRIYLTEVTPQDAVPLMSGEEAQKFESYLKGEKIPRNINERLEKFMLNLKFKWKHGIARRFTEMVPVGGHKLENVLVLAVDKTAMESVLKKDEFGEVYVEDPIKLRSDQNFYVAGPYTAKED